ncbi:MAG: hypothetical protein KME21_14595 [Desmonostoc vinosum HA7617-LM4]|nr:hypothetical protein [Desmonostoc vinosum HA7617-LM4]
MRGADFGGANLTEVNFIRKLLVRSKTTYENVMIFH